MSDSQSINEADVLDGQQIALDALTGYSDVDKIAILKGAAGTVESILSAKTMGIIIANTLNGGKQ